MSSDGRKWFEKRKDFVSQPRTAAGTEETPDLLTRCPGCGVAVYNDDLEANHMVCPECSHHLKISAIDRLLLLCDGESIEVHDTHLEPVDALGFVILNPIRSGLSRQRRRRAATKPLSLCPRKLRAWMLK